MGAHRVCRKKLADEISLVEWHLCRARLRCSGYLVTSIHTQAPIREHGSHAGNLRRHAARRITSFFDFGLIVLATFLSIGSTRSYAPMKDHHVSWLPLALRETGTIKVLANPSCFCRQCVEFATAMSIVFAHQRRPRPVRERSANEG